MTVGAAVYEKEEAEALRYFEAVIARASQEGLHSFKAVLHIGQKH